MLKQGLVAEPEIPPGAVLRVSKAPQLLLLRYSPVYKFLGKERQSSPSSHDNLPVAAAAKIPPNLGDRVHLFTQPLLEEGEA